MNSELPTTELRDLLLERHDSLDAAFRWLDVTNSGRINMFQWDTGLRVLSLNKVLTGLRPAKIFAAMDARHTGEVTLKAWREYFGYECEDDAVAPAGRRLVRRATFDEHAAFVARDRLAGPRGARLLQNVRKLATSARALASLTEGKRSYDDMYLGTPGLPKVEAILELADEEECEIVGPHSKAASMKSLVATDSEKAEEMQLQEDLQQQDYHKIRALAYILVAKCGSLDAAFHWLDCCNRGGFVRVQWETAAIVLHIDIEKLTGLSTRNIFFKMAGNRARVSKKAWDGFFAQELDLVDLEKLGSMQRHFQKRCRKKLKEVWKGKDPVQGKKRNSRPSSKIKNSNLDNAKVVVGSPGEPASSSAAVTVPTGPTLDSRSRAAHETPQRVGSASRPTSQQVGHRGSNSSAGVAAGAGARAGVAADTAAGAGNAMGANASASSTSGGGGTSHSASAGAGVNASAVAGAGSSASAGSPGGGGASSSTSGTKDRDRKRSKGSSGSTFTGVPSVIHSDVSTGTRSSPQIGTIERSAGRKSTGHSVPVVASTSAASGQQRSKLAAEHGAGGRGTRASSPSPEEQRRIIREELSWLAPDEGREYTPSKRSERNLIEEVAREMGLWCGQAGTQGMLVFREGDVAARLRREVVALEPGEFTRVKGLSSMQALFGQAVAPASGIWATLATAAKYRTHGEALELFNLGGSLEDFAAGVRRALQKLAPGEVVDFPALLGEERRKIVQEVAKDLDLISKTFKDPAGACISVGNLLDFERRCLQELVTIVPGESRQYGPGHCEQLGVGLTRMERALLQQAATELGLQSSEKEDGHGDYLITVQQAVLTLTGSDEKRGAPSPPDIDDIRQKVAELFGHYSSGKHGETRFFLRKNDLTRFVRDAAEVSPRGHILKAELNSILRECERVFDDTLELQIDLGCHKRYGLILDYFQVFLSKAAFIMGWSMVSLLFALLQLFED